ncbi:uncharacterized protein LOC134811291 isoform X2 [Bolinopsis microptera]|uniref:uncharacterized protein LOC134811291 isoform X2 n=1 Tax=Bolinopsis microptera TaxID=2820187 RepID=UPI0030793372
MADASDRLSFGDPSQNTKMFGGLFVLLASWGLGGNLLLCALIYQGNLWTMMNRGLMAVSALGIFQSVFCLLPIGISGINEAWDFGDVWCSAYPYLYRFSQISLTYMIALLLFYNIMALRTDNNPSKTLKTSSLWAPVVIFLLPYLILLPPALVFLEDFGVTDIQEDRSNLHACTIVVTDESDGYQSFRAVETVFGLIIPYIGVIVLFGYLVALINQRKDSKTCNITDSYEFKECDLPTRTSTEVLSDNNSEADIPVHINYNGTRDEAMSPVHTMESLAARSDKHTEVVIYVLTGTFLLVFAPYLYQTLSELADPNKIKENNSLFRFLSHFLSYMVVLVNPTIYTLQYPTIKESLMKRDLLKFNK